MALLARDALGLDSAAPCRGSELSVLAMELTRLDAMQAAVYAEAINGDTGAPAPASSAFVQCFPKDLLGFFGLCNPLQLLRKKPVWSLIRAYPETSCRSLGNLLKHGRSQPR